MTDWRDDEWEALMERTRGTTDPGAPDDGAAAAPRDFWLDEREAPTTWVPEPVARIEPSVAEWAGGDDAAAWAATAGGGLVPEPAAWDAETTGSMPLPHWTEPPTGEIPRITDESDDWSALSGAAPRFRSDSGDWAAGDFEAGELAHDDSTLVGALDEYPAEEPAMPMTRRERREAREAASAKKGRRGGRPDPAGGPVGAVAPVPGAAEFGVADEFGESGDFGDVDDAPIGVGRSGRPGPSGGGVGDPGSLEGGARPEPGARSHETGADTSRRLVTAGLAALVAVVCFFLGPIPTLLLAMAVVGVGAFELYESLRRAGYHTATLVGLVGSVAIVPLAYDQGTAAFPMMIFLVVAFTMLWYLFEVMRARPTVNVALTLMVFAYVGCFGAFAGLMLAPKHGVGYVLGVVLCVIAYDVVGWFVGRSSGRTPLMPRVSPNKTVEGLIGGMIAALIMGVVVVSVVDGWKQGGFADGLLLGLVMAIAAPLGDLVESMLKRDLGVKDFGNVLPGHGGVLDRFDALLFALPVGYYVALHVLT